MAETNGVMPRNGNGKIAWMEVARTLWPPMLAVAGVIAWLTITLFSHMQEPGHSVMVERVNGLAHEIKEVKSENKEDHKEMKSDLKKIIAKLPQ